MEKRILAWCQAVLLEEVMVLDAGVRTARLGAIAGRVRNAIVEGEVSVGSCQVCGFRMETARALMALASRQAGRWPGKA